MRSLWGRLLEVMRHAIHWGDRRVPPGLRSVVGVLFLIGGAVGFLPIVGFWMLPAGLALIALDVPPLRHRLLAWADRQGDRSAGSGQATGYRAGSERREQDQAER